MSSVSHSNGFESGRGGVPGEREGSIVRAGAITARVTGLKPRDSTTPGIGRHSDMEAVSFCFFPLQTLNSKKKTGGFSSVLNCPPTQFHYPTTWLIIIRMQRRVSMMT